MGASMCSQHIEIDTNKWMRRYRTTFFFLLTKQIVGEPWDRRRAPMYLGLSLKLKSKKQKKKVFTFRSWTSGETVQDKCVFFDFPQLDLPGNFSRKTLFVYFPQLDLQGHFSRKTRFGFTSRIIYTIHYISIYTETAFAFCILHSAFWILCCTQLLESRKCKEKQ